MNLFSSDEFLDAYGNAYFPKEDRQTAVFDVEGRHLRTLLVNEHVPLCSGPFFDFLQPMDPPPSRGDVRKLGWVPRTVLETVELGDATPYAGPHQPSPYVDWRRFPNWDDFLAHVAGRRSGLWSDSRRKWRKLEKALGKVVFHFDDRSEEAFEQCVRWKRAQYARSNFRDGFATGQGARLFKALIADGAAVCSTLWAGDTLVAAHLGGLWNRRFYWWVPTYDPKLAQYSPGRLMLHALLETSYTRGDEEFDFLIGNEDYKFHYATHDRIVGEMGATPLRVRLDRGFRRIVRGALAPFPGVMEWSRRIRNRR